jgi:adenylate cyclase
MMDHLFVRAWAPQTRTLHPARSIMTPKANGELIPVGGGDPIPLIRERLTIGRRESSDICLRFPNVSGLHCELNFLSGHWVIRDLGSTNGVKVNDVLVQQRTLRPGDEISIAKRRFTIEYTPCGPEPFDEDSPEETGLQQSLLDLAGLTHPPRPRRARVRRHGIDPSSGLFHLEPDDGL